MTQRGSAALEGPAMGSFEQLAAAAARVCGTAAAAVTLAAAGRHWVQASFGFGSRKGPTSMPFSELAKAQGEALILPDVTLDPRFAQHPLVTGPPYVRFFAGVPLRVGEGEVTGVLYVVDVQPRTLSEEQLELLGVFADQVVAQLKLRRQWVWLAELDRQQRAEQIVRRDQARRSLQSFTEAIGADIDEKELQAHLLERIYEVLPVEAASLRLMSPDGNYLEPGHALGMAVPNTGRRIEVDTDAVDAIVRSGRPFVVHRLDDTEQSRMLPPGVASVCSVPLLAGKQVLGFLAVGNRNVDQLTEEDVDLLGWLADRLSLAIQARTRETELARTQARWQAIAQNFIDPLLNLRPVRDDDGNIVDFVTGDSNPAHDTYRVTRPNVPVHMARRSPVLFAGLVRTLETGEPLVVEAVHIGDDDASELGPGEAHYIDVRAVRLEGEIVGSWRDVTARVRAQQELSRRVLYDSLTGLPNRELMIDRLDIALSALERDRDLVAVIFIDLDRFKSVNDSYGHKAGDLVLVETSRRLQHLLRPGDTACRISGDEFVVIVPGIDSESDLVAVATRLLSALEQPIELADGNRVHLGASLGMTLAEDASVSGAALVAEADAAMYEAKRRGGHRHVVFTETLYRQDAHHMTVEADLRRALEEGWFQLHYQPVLDLRDGRIVGAEALLRIQHPDRGLLQPDAFIEVAEGSRLMLPIGEWVLNQACSQLVTWRRVADITMAINVSGRQVLDASLSDQVLTAAENTGVDPAQLCLEVTERVLLDAGPAIKRDLETLSRRGVLLALDDFGTGYSSLSYLQHFPVDVVKIDQSFVAGLGQRSKDEAIVSAVMALGSTLDLEVVAEGVESGIQLEELQRLGCRRAQGYYFGAPVDASAFTRLLSTARSSAPEGS